MTPAHANAGAWRRLATSLALTLGFVPGDHRGAAPYRGGAGAAGSM
jgi:hypothetical protein